MVTLLSLGRICGHYYLAEDYSSIGMCVDRFKIHSGSVKVFPDLVNSKFLLCLLDILYSSWKIMKLVKKWLLKRFCVQKLVIEIVL